MVGFLPPRERGQQIVANGFYVELIELAAFVRSNERQQTIGCESDFGPAVEVVISRSDLRPRLLIGLP